MLCVDKDTLHEKQKLSVDFADLIYNGKWFTPCARRCPPLLRRPRGMSPAR